MDTLHKAFDWYLAHTLIQWIFLAYGVLFIIERLFGRRFGIHHRGGADRRPAQPHPDRHQGAVFDGAGRQ